MWEKLFRVSKPNYPVIELQAENDKLKDEIIEILKNKILILEAQIKAMIEVTGKLPVIEYVPTNDSVVKARPRYRTTTEALKALESLSLEKKRKLDEI